MKAIIDKHLISRLNNAAYNGSVVATAVLAELEKDTDEIFDGKCNYFASKKFTGTYTADDDDRRGDIEWEFHTVSVSISYCNKDLNNERFPDYGNPQAPYFNHNRTETSPNGFVDLFVNLRNKFTSEELQYFDSAIRLNTKVVLRIGNSMTDFYHAYQYTDYYNTAQSTYSSLHKSCMRHDYQTSVCADFYVNFAGASILIAETEEGDVLGRAILWNGVKFCNGTDGHVNLVDRIYSTYDFLIPLMKAYASQNGYHICKTANDADSTRNFTALVDLNEDDNGLDASAGYKFTQSIYYDIHEIPRHNRQGAPYLDTLYNVCYADDVFYLSNCEDDNRVATSRSSGAYAERYYHICPICGGIHDNHSSKFGYICEDCECEICSSTPSGLPIYKCECEMHNGGNYPYQCLRHNPDGSIADFSNNYLAAIALRKICN